MSPQADLQSRAEELFRLPWSREVLADEDGGYLARVPELPGCFADGDTMEEALANLNVVLREWLTISLERGDSIPGPRRIDDSFSGRFSVAVTPPASTDVSEGIAADAVRSGSQAIAALKGIGTLLRDRGQINLACVVYA